MVLELSSRLGNLQFVRVRTHPEDGETLPLPAHAGAAAIALHRRKWPVTPEESRIRPVAPVFKSLETGRCLASRSTRWGRGPGSFQGSCTSNQQTALVEVQSFSGVPYHRGKAVARAFASTFTGSASDGPEAIQID